MITSGFAPADGTQLYYEVAGEGPPLVLLHPGQAGLVIWEPQFLTFARGHRVVRYDARGFGQSERPDTDFSFYDDLRCVLDALGVERASLVGLSLGGRTAVDFAIAYPDRVAALVLVNPGISGYVFTSLERFSAEAQEITARGDTEAYVELQLRTWLDGPKRTAADVDPEVREGARQAIRAQVELAARRDTRPKLREVGALERLGEIRAPTLIVESMLDVPDNHAIADILERGIPGSRRTMIRDAAHLVNLERPREFAMVVLDFLDSVRA